MNLRVIALGDRGILHLWRTTLCRSNVWIGMKLLQANSIIQSTRKLWWIFPIKQKFDTTAAFSNDQNYSIWTSFQSASRLRNGQKTLSEIFPNSTSFKHSYYKKAVALLNFCLTTGFWGKEAWRPTPKWNTRFFFAFSKRNQLWLP